MPRASRHKSTRSHKHGSRDESEERKPRAEDPEKKKPSSQTADLAGPGNGEIEHGKKRKDRQDDSLVSDRWTGGGEDDHAVDKKPKGDAFRAAESDKSGKSGAPVVDLKDSKNRSNRSEKNETEPARRRSEKESNRRESASGQYKDTKDRDRDETKDVKDKEGDHSKEAKDRDRDRYKDVKDKDGDRVKETREKEKDRDCSKDAKVREKDRDYMRDAEERERDYHKHAKERERERDHRKDTKEREKDYTKDAKEKDRERGSERDKKVQDARHERSDDMESRKQASKASGSQEEHGSRKGMEISDGKIQEDLRNPELEKELDKRIRRRESSGDKVKCLDDVRDSDEKQVARDNNPKNSSYKDDSHGDDKYRDKYRDDLDRDKKHHDGRGRDDRVSRDHSSSRSENKHFKDENRLSDSRYKKSKIQDKDHDGSPDDHSIKLKDSRGRKRFSEVSDDHIDSKPRSAKEPHEDTEKHLPSTSKFDSHPERNRLDNVNTEKVDSSTFRSRPKSSPGSGNHSLKEQNRPSSKQTGLSSRKSDEALHSGTDSRGDHATLSGVHERGSDSRSVEKTRRKEDGRSHELIEAPSHYDRTPRSDTYTLPNPLSGKSINDRRLSDRTSDRAGVGRSLDSEGQKSSSSKDRRGFSNIRERERAFPSEKSIPGDLSRSEMPKIEPFSLGLSSFNRAGHFAGSLSNHLPPPPPGRHGADSPSGMGSYEDGNKVQLGERKVNNRYKRSAEPGMGRGQGNAWKSATWPSPVANGFLPFQHGPPHSGFHSAVHQFPHPPLFGVRPVDLSHAGVPYHVHEAADRFSGHVRPFGWHNAVDDCPPQLQAWDGSAGVFGDEAHVYGRSGWDMNKHLIGNRGWDMRADMLKGQNGNMNMEIPLPQESDYSAHALSGGALIGSTGHTEQAQPEQPQADSSEIKHFDISPGKNIETLKKCLREKTPDSVKTPSHDNDIYFCCNYLSKLDISLELVPPELYNKCLSVLGAGGATSASGYSAVKPELPKDKRDSNVTARSTNHIINSIFPTIKDAVFQRSMSLYKKQNEGRKVKHPLSPSVGAEQKDSSNVSSKEVKEDLVISTNASLEEIVKPVDTMDTDSADVKLACADIAVTFADAMLRCADSASNMEVESNTMDVVGFHPGDIKEQQSDSISVVVPIIEESQSCEPLFPECRVNVSRIHLSPGSMH